MPTASSIHSLFSALPDPLVEHLEKSYIEIKMNFVQRKYEPSELNGGKFCEVVLRILEWHTSTPKNYSQFGIRITDFGQTTRKFESLTGFPDSVRFHIPKILNALYDIRNKRGVGHVGGDINPNHMDALLIVSATDWIMAELVRIFHNISVTEAQKVVESLISKKIATVWEIGGKKRVLNTSLKFDERTLLLLYDSYPKSLQAGMLAEWTEYKNRTEYRTKLLGALHRKKFVEYNVNTGEVCLSPLGIKYVEENISFEL